MCIGARLVIDKCTIAYVGDNIGVKVIAVTVNVSKKPIKKLYARDAEGQMIHACVRVTHTFTIYKIEAKFIGAAKINVFIIGSTRLSVGMNPFVRNVNALDFVSVSVEPPSIHMIHIKCIYYIF